MGHDLLKLTVRCDRDAPARVREAICDLRDLDPVKEDALLVASELVSNAVLHSGCVEGEPLEVHVSSSAESVLISVADPGLSEQEATRRSGPTRDGVGGWGLQLVSLLALRWGTERRSRHRVWAELGLPGSRLSV